MKKVLPLIFSILIASCQVFENHSHDGRYFTAFNVLGTKVADIYYEINGNQIIINNSATGTSKLQCKQYDDRIEYSEQDGTTRIIYALDNGDLKLNDNFILTKIKYDVTSTKDTSVTKHAQSNTKSTGSKLNLPFIGIKKFETRPGISGAGTPMRSIEITKDGDVFFRFKQINQIDKTVTEDTYPAGKFQKILKCYFKSWGGIVTYYIVTNQTIYEVDKNGNQLSSDECCKDLSKNNCGCSSEYLN